MGAPNLLPQTTSSVSLMDGPALRVFLCSSFQHQQKPVQSSGESMSLEFSSQILFCSPYLLRAQSYLFPHLPMQQCQNGSLGEGCRGLFQVTVHSEGVYLDLHLQICWIGARIWQLPNLPRLQIQSAHPLSVTTPSRPPLSHPTVSRGGQQCPNMCRKAPAFLPPLQQCTTSCAAGSAFIAAIKEILLVETLAPAVLQDHRIANPSLGTAFNFFC